ncbi:MAG: hypothetical protein L0Z55_03660, partial [Planctomycetes bacterium]|nr:hypothetical protein [Planctomycetota bacterium]
MRIAHLTIGVLSLAAFLATGFWMHFYFPGAYGGDGAMRMSFRSAHCYILYAGLLNLLIAAHLAPAKGGARRALIAAGSIPIIACPVLCVIAFCVEPGPKMFEG